MTTRTKKIIRGNSKRNDKTLKKKKRSKINNRRLNSNRKKIYKRSTLRRNKRTKRRRIGNFNRKKKKIQNGGFIPLILIGAIKIIASSQASKDAMQNFINYLLSHIFGEEDFALLDDDCVNDIQLATNISKGIIHNVSCLLQGPHGLVKLFIKIMGFLRNFVVNSFLKYLVENLRDVITVLSDGATELHDQCLELISCFFRAEVGGVTFSSENLKDAISSGLQLQTAKEFATAITAKAAAIYTGEGEEEEQKLKKILDTAGKLHAVLEGPGKSIKKKITQKLFELMKMIPESICVHLFESFRSALEKRKKKVAEDGAPDYNTENQGIKLRSLLINKLHSAKKSISISDVYEVDSENFLSIAACQTEFNELIESLSDTPDDEPEPEPDMGGDLELEPTPVVETRVVKLCYEVGWLHDVKQGVNHIDYIGGVESLLDRKEEHLVRGGDDSEALFSVSVFLQVMGNNPCEHIGEAKSMLFGEEFIYDFNDNHETHVADIAGMLHQGDAAAPPLLPPEEGASPVGAALARLRGAVNQVIAANSQRSDSTLERDLKGIKIDSLTGRICFASIIKKANIFYHENKCYCRGWFPFVEEKWAEYRRHYKHIYEELERIELREFVELFIKSQFYLKYDIKASIVGETDEEITVLALGKEYQVDEDLVVSDSGTVVGRWDAGSTSIIFPTMDPAAEEAAERFYEIYGNPPGPPDPDSDSDPPAPPDPDSDPPGPPDPDSFQKFIELYVRLLSFMKLMCMFIFYHRKWNSGVRNEYKVKYLLAYIQKRLTLLDGEDPAPSVVDGPVFSDEVRPAFGQLEERRTLTNLIVNHGLSGLLGDGNCFDIVRVVRNPKPTDLDSLKTLFGGSPGQLAKPCPNIFCDLGRGRQPYKVWKVITCSNDFTVSIFPAGASLSYMRDNVSPPEINLLDPGNSWDLDLSHYGEALDYIEGLELSGDENHKLIVTFQALREQPHADRELETLKIGKIGQSLLWVEYDDDDLSSWPEASKLSSILLGDENEFADILKS